MAQHPEFNQLTDIRKEKMPVSALEIGMFVCELDRPWLGTPFLLEGVLIEDASQIATITGLCEFVYIDRTVSLGEHYLAPHKKSIAIKRSHSIPVHQAVMPSSNKESHVEEIKRVDNNIEQRSFFNIIRESCRKK